MLILPYHGSPSGRERGVVRSGVSRGSAARSCVPLPLRLPSVVVAGACPSANEVRVPAFRAFGCHTSGRRKGVPSNVANVGVQRENPRQLQCARFFAMEFRMFNPAGRALAWR